LLQSRSHGRVFFLDVFQGLRLDGSRPWFKPVFPFQKLFPGRGVKRINQEVEIVFGKVPYFRSGFSSSGSR